jgi:4-hydroxy-tetrahydrodipicolinate synthase
MGEEVGESRYAVAFDAQQTEQIRQIVTKSLQ